MRKFLNKKIPPPQFISTFKTTIEKDRERKSREKRERHTVR